MQRLYGAVLSVLLIGLSVWPAIKTPSTDSFPFSNYPMFARKKGHPLVHRVVGVTAKGERLRVPPEMIANDEVMQAYRTVRAAVRKGKKGTALLCRDTAERIIETGSMKDVIRLEVLSDRYDAVRYFTHAPIPIRSRTHSICPVNR
jgi:hypothetical protein